MAVEPKRGDVFWLEWEPARGVEQRGRRPALVIQNNRGNANSGYTVVAAISSAPLPRVYPFVVPLQPGDANLTRGGHVNCSQIMTVDKSRLENFIGSLAPNVMQQVDDALVYELDL